MVGEGGADMRERIRNEGEKRKDEERMKKTRLETRGSTEREDGEAQDQQKAGYQLAVELEDASLLE